jgi:hypothetical protein
MKGIAMYSGLEYCARRIILLYSENCLYTGCPLNLRVVSDFSMVPLGNLMQMEFTIAPFGMKRTPSRSSPFVTPEAAKTSSFPLASSSWL